MLSNRIAGSVSLLIGVLLTACRQTPPKAEASVGQLTTVPVVKVENVTWPSVYEAVGTVRARTSTVIASRMMAYVRSVNVRLGDSVIGGQLLIVLDARDLDAARRMAQAVREEAASAAVEADHAVASARAQLDLARITYRRISDLYQKNSVSNQEYDEASAKLKVAQAKFDTTVSRQALVLAKTHQAEESMAASEISRSYAEIRAPFAGTVTERQIEAGALAAPGAPLLTMEQAGGFRLEVAVEESLLATIRIGQPVTVKLDSLDQSVIAKVSEVVPSVDAATRSFLVKVDLPSVPRLRSGVYGRAQFARGTRHAIVLPVAAVSEQGQVQSVMVVEDGVARARLITTGQKQGDWIEVLSGVSAGEQVVSPRPSTLLDGARVEPRP
jgi:membrane fusion protein, multidrug efflux system